MIALDIETVPNETAIKSRQWAEYKEKKEIKDDQHAALLPAFGQVVCVCAYSLETKRKLSICTDDELTVLSRTSTFLLDHENDDVLGGHNIKGFDNPFLANRMLAHKMRVPSQMRTLGKKPWEIKHVDTMDIFKFGNGTPMSLDAVCLLLGIPSPKEGEVNALSVWDAFKQKNFAQIETYCGKGDVSTWLKIWNHIKGNV